LEKQLKIIADMHVHSKFSVDGKDDLMAMCQAAIEKGLGYICFTEHFDINPKYHGYGYFDFKEFSKAVDSARSQFADRLCILKGLELNEPHLYPVEFENVLKEDLDVVLGSVHWLGEFLVSDKELQERFKKEEIFEKYYAEVLKTTKFGGFDILAHLDSPKRYWEQPYGGWSLIDEILGELAKSGIALEINTLPLRKGLNECSPDKDLLERYVKHKGRRVCTGSDAHSSLDIGAGFEYAQDLVGRYSKIDVGIFQKHEFLSISPRNICGVD
jgi:histidinol-phosphatase (PHP family)